MAKSKALVNIAKIRQHILLIRGEKVIMDADPAEVRVEFADSVSK